MKPRDYARLEWRAKLVLLGLLACCEAVVSGVAAANEDGPSSVVAMVAAYVLLWTLKTLTPPRRPRVERVMPSKPTLRLTILDDSAVADLVIEDSARRARVRGEM